MIRIGPLALSLVLAAVPLTPAPAQSSPDGHPATTADTSSADDADVGEGRRGMQYGLASGGLRYPGGRTEQAMGAVVRWVPVQWLSLSATPTAVRVHEPATTTTTPVTRSGLVDLPLELSVSHAFAGRYTPTLSAGLGTTLPLGDSTAGLGSGSMGWSATVGAGFSPTDNVWMHASAGRSLSGLSMASAYSSASGWADLGGGTNVTPRVSVEGGYSSDFGDVDAAVGRSTSVSGSVAVVLRGATTFNVSTSHGLGGAAPDWSVALGIGTAFPYLSHLGAGSSLDNLRNTFGSGSHGLGGSASSGRGRTHP